jgi:hypothetical protein
MCLITSLASPTRCIECHGDIAHVPDFLFPFLFLLLAHHIHLLVDIGLTELFSIGDLNATSRAPFFGDGISMIRQRPISGTSTRVF